MLRLSLSFNQVEGYLRSRYMYIIYCQRNTSNDLFFVLYAFTKCGRPRDIILSFLTVDSWGFICKTFQLMYSIETFIILKPESNQTVVYLDECDFLLFKFVSSRVSVYTDWLS